MVSFAYWVWGNYCSTVKVLKLCLAAVWNHQSSSLHEGCFFRVMTEVLHCLVIRAVFIPLWFSDLVINRVFYAALFIFNFTFCNDMIFLLAHSWILLPFHLYFIDLNSPTHRQMISCFKESSFWIINHLKDSYRKLL